MNVSLSPFAPEDLASRDRFGHLFPRQRAHYLPSGSIYISIYLYLYISIYIYGHLLYQSMDQQSEITNPACGQLNRENECLPFPVRAREFGPARQVWRSHPAPACPFSTLRLNPVLTDGIPPAFHSRHRISPETPSPQEGLRVLRRCYEEHIIINVACRGDIRRRR